VESKSIDNSNIGTVRWKAKASTTVTGAPAPATIGTPSASGAPETRETSASFPGNSEKVNIATKNLLKT
jgi:hypothetical protein